jgi:diguanylate cyclase (GGDEF)-like protein
LPTPRARIEPVVDAVATAEFLAMLDVETSDALPGWLAETLRARQKGATGRVLRVHPARAARIKSAASAMEAFAVAGGVEDQPVPLGDDPVLVEAVRARKPCAVRADVGARLLVPLVAGGAVRHLVDVRGLDDVRPDDPLLLLAGKYYERLVEGETDPLTRLANRRLFQQQVDEGVKRWACTGRAYYFAMLDLDRFKRINDDFGHLYGDEILVHFANLMRATFRSGDQLYRFGGEEFVVIFGVEPPERGGEATLERFRRAVEEYDFPGVGKVTVSIGFTRVAEANTPAAMLIDRADEALYFAKEHGRNRVCGWEALVEAGEIAPKAAPKGEVTLF